MANFTMAHDLPPLPSYTLQPLPPVISWIDDKYLTLALPVIAYWLTSLFFHMIDTFDVFPQYRLHTPAELLKRNHVSRYEVLRDVIIQHVVQTIFGLGLALVEPDPVYGKEDYDVGVWAQRIRIAQRAVPFILSIIGVNSEELAKKFIASSPTMAAVLAGGSYPWLTQTTTVNGQGTTVPGFAGWEIIAAKFIYWVAVPAMQFFLAIVVVDTWQYFWHRGMHMNKWLYTTLHSRHHRLYVPYAYGALYNHPVEGFLLDTLGTGLAYLVSGMTPRQSMWLFTISTIKTVDDHCGYAFPWDPLQFVTKNNAAYHDIHHQSWGIKTNFSQPFFIFWDKLLDTQWKGGDVKLRYERSAAAAQQKLQKDAQKPDNTPSTTDKIVAPETAELEVSKEPIASIRRSPRKRATSSAQQAGSLKGLRDRMSVGIHGNGGVLGMDNGH